MKYSILLITALFTLSNNAHGQDTSTKSKLVSLNRPSSSREETDEEKLPVDEATNKVSYSDVVTVTGVSKAQLFNRAKKWVATKNSSINPYTISFDNEQEGNVVAKGSFTIPDKRKKYPVQFVVKVSAKDNKFKYEFTDFIVQFRTEAGVRTGGYGRWSSSTYHDAESFEYPLETFYPSRLHGRKPSIKYFEGIDSDAFAIINKEMQSLIASLKQSLSSKDDW